MGGLAGVVHFSGDPPEMDRVERMAAALAHRGPDGQGRFTDGTAALGHRRRSLGPGPGQPLITDQLVVLLDGWIYEHEALARDAGHPTGQVSDTEALALAFQAWGPASLTRLEGEHAFALWERGPKRLWLVRDRLGVRPLFFTRRGDQLAFASEIRALHEVPWVSRRPDPERLAEFLSFGALHAPRTWFSDVQQLEPATAWSFEAGRASARPTWQVPYAPPGTPAPPDAALVEPLQALVAQAVLRRVPRGVPTGLYLSGGLGSTAIAAAARDHHLHLPSYTVSLDDDPHAEAPFAARVARLLGLEHHPVVVGSRDLPEAFEAVVQALGPQVGHPSALLQWRLGQAAREQVRVVLSGDGAEELFGGRMLDAAVRQLRMARWAGRLPGWVQRWLPPSWRTSAAAAGAAARQQVTALGLGGAQVFTGEQRRLLLRDHGLVKPTIRQDVLDPIYAGLETDPLNLVLHGHLRSSLASGSLVRGDRTAAANGLDPRFPLLDRSVVEAAAALPGLAKVRRVAGSLHTRWPLRALLSGVLPPPLVNRPKRGQPAPLDDWLSGPGRLFFEDRFARLLADRHGLWRRDGLLQLRRDLGKGGVGLRLWMLFLLDTWWPG